MYQLIKNKMMESPNDYLSIKFKTNLINKFLGLKILFSKWKFSQKWGGRWELVFTVKLENSKKKPIEKKIILYFQLNFISSVICKWNVYCNYQSKCICLRWLQRVKFAIKNNYRVKRYNCTMNSDVQWAHIYAGVRQATEKSIYNSFILSTRFFVYDSIFSQQHLF